MDGRHGGRRRRRRGLATPPEPQAITISLDERRASTEPTGIREAGERHDRPSVTQLGGEGVGDLAGGPQAVTAEEQVRHVKQRHGRVDPGSQPLEVLGPAAPAGHGQPGGVEQRPGRRAERLFEGGLGVGLVDASKTSSSPRPNSSGRTD